MAKLSPRKKFIESASLKRLARHSWDAMQLASTHDPDHAKILRDIISRIQVIERQLYRMGAPQYRRVYGGSK